MVCPAARAERRERRISSARGMRGGGWGGEGVGVGTREVRSGREVEKSGVEVERSGVEVEIAAGALEWRISSTGAARTVEKRSVNSKSTARWSVWVGFGVEAPLAWELRFLSIVAEGGFPVALSAD